MSRRATSTLFFAPSLFFWMALLSLPAQGALLNLDSVFSTALQKSESYQTQKSKLLQADELKAQALGSIFPTLEFSLNRTQYDTSGGAISPNSLVSKFTLLQPLFQGTAEYAGFRYSNANYRAQEATVKQTARTLYGDVARTYFEVLSSEQDLRNLKSSTELTNKRLSELESRAKIGRSRKGEVLSARAQLASLQAEVNAAEATRAVAREQFSLVTGLPRETELNEQNPGVTLPGRLDPLEQYLATVSSRPDLIAARESVQSADELVAVARAGHLPTLDLSANYYVARENTTYPNLKWDVLLSLTVPLFAGGVTQSKLRDSVETRKQGELALALTERTAQTQVQTTYRKVEAGLTQLNLLEQALQAAESNFQEQSKDYRYGLVTNLDVLAALNSLQDAKRAYDKTRYATLANFASLLAITGKLNSKLEEL